VSVADRWYAWTDFQADALFDEAMPGALQPRASCDVISAY